MMQTFLEFVDYNHLVHAVLYAFHPLRLRREVCFVCLISERR